MFPLLLLAVGYDADPVPRYVVDPPPRYTVIVRGAPAPRPVPVPQPVDPWARPPGFKLVVPAAGVPVARPFGPGPVTIPATPARGAVPLSTGLPGSTVTAPIPIPVPAAGRPGVIRGFPCPPGRP